MDFLDNAVNKAKEAIDVACKKTGEVVNTQKQKFDIAALENKRAKDCETLGEIYFNLLKNSEIADEKTAEAVAAIKEKNARIKLLKEEINALKNKRICPKCGAAIDNEANYCNLCGAKLVFENEE